MLLYLLYYVCGVNAYLKTQVGLLHDETLETLRKTETRLLPMLLYLLYYVCGVIAYLKTQVGLLHDETHSSFLGASPTKRKLGVHEDGG